MNRYGGHVGHVTWTVFPQLKEALYEILLQLPSGFLGDVWNCHSTV